MRAAVVGRALQLSPSIARLILTTKYDSGFPNELTSGVWPSSASATNPPHAKQPCKPHCRAAFSAQKEENGPECRVPATVILVQAAALDQRVGTSQFQLRGAM